MFISASVPSRTVVSRGRGRDGRRSGPRGQRQQRLFQQRAVVRGRGAVGGRGSPSSTRGVLCAHAQRAFVSGSLPGRASAPCTFNANGPLPCWSSRQVSLRHAGLFASRVTSKTHRPPPSPPPSDCSAFSPGAGGVDGEPRPLRAAPRAPSQHPLGGQPLPLCGIRRLAREVRGQPAGTVFGQADRRCGAGTQMLHALRVLAAPRQVRARGAAARGL